MSLGHNSLWNAFITDGDVVILPAGSQQQWRFQSGWVTQAGDTRGARSRLMGGENLVPPPNCRALDWCVVFTVPRLCPIVPQDNIVVSNKHN